MSVSLLLLSLTNDTIICTIVTVIIVNYRIIVITARS